MKNSTAYKITNKSTIHAKSSNAEFNNPEIENKRSTKDVINRRMGDKWLLYDVSSNS